jgi:hypothetical protein
LGISLRIAPGVRISASGSGIRSSVGPRVARVHVGSGGAGVSSGVGPFTASASTRSRSRTSSKPAKRAASARKAPPSKVDTAMAGLELATGVMMMLDYALERRNAKKLAADSVQAAKLLTTLHLEDFPQLTEPVAEVAPRSLRRLGRVNAEEQAALDEAYAREVARWDKLRSHDPDEVIGSVEDALADNASQSACIDAGTSPTGHYVTLVVHYPGLEITQGIVQAGTNTRPRTEKEMIDLYRRSIASTVIATAKEALAYAPAATEAYVVVLRYDVRGRFRKTTTQLDAIYAGSLGRTVLDVDWKARSPIDYVLRAREVRVSQDRKGRFRPLGDDAGDDLRRLVASLEATIAAAAQERPKRRKVTHDQSQLLMQSQAHQEFVAISACPSCGYIDAHPLRAPGPGEPEWADVIRTCAECDREWAQA